MSMGYIKDGEYVQVAGNAEPSGELVVGASTVRKGTFLATNEGQSNPLVSVATITFAEPMPDADYEINIEQTGTTGGAGERTAYQQYISNKTKNGFTINYYFDLADYNAGTPGTTWETPVKYSGRYTAFKLIEKEDIQDLTDNVEAIDNKISELATSTNKLVSKSELQEAMEKMFHVGYVHLSFSDVNPATHFGFGTWVRIGQGVFLQGASANGQAGTSVAAGLPNITGAVANASGCVTDANDNNLMVGTGVFQATAYTGPWRYVNANIGTVNGPTGATFDASRSSPVYGRSTTVQPPAIFINMWRRTA